MERDGRWHGQSLLSTLLAFLSVHGFRPHWVRICWPLPRAGRKIWNFDAWELLVGFSFLVTYSKGTPLSGWQTSHPFSMQWIRCRALASLSRSLSFMIWSLAMISWRRAGSWWHKSSRSSRAWLRSHSWPVLIFWISRRVQGDMLGWCWLELCSLDRSLTLPVVKNFFSAWTSPTNKLLEPSRQARG